MIRSDRRLTFFYASGDLFTLLSVFTGLQYYHRSAYFSNQDYLYMLTITLVWLFITSKNKVYSLNLYNGIKYRFKNHLKSLYQFVGVLAMLYLVIGIPGFTRLHFVSFLILFPVADLLVNYLLFLLVGKMRGRGRHARSALVIGAGAIGEHIEDYFIHNPDFGYNITGYLEDELVHPLLQDKVLGKIRDIDRVLMENSVHEIIIALPTHLDEKIQFIINKADYYGIRVRLVPDYFRLLGRNYSVDSFGDMPILNIREISLDKLHLASFKRISDIVFSLAALILLAPVFLVIAIAIKLESPGPVIYCPIRLGQGGRPFKLYKFRSMRQNDAAIGGTNSTVKDDPRITRVGRFIRKYSLDELPQFFNVLLGDMSVVGPRPHRIHLNQVMQQQVVNYMVRHYLKPGITGWAQVNGWRGPTETEEQRYNRTSHDLWYVENWTPLLDIKILFLTVFGVKTHRAAF